MADFNIHIGELRTRITFQEPTLSKDAGAAQSESYADAGTDPTVWSRWINDHGQESAGNAEVSVQRATVTVRYRSDVLESWQVIKDGASWSILSIDQIRDRNRWTELRVERVKGTVQ